MPTAVYTIDHAIGATGRHIPFEVLYYAIDDLLEFGYLHVQEAYVARFWINSYETGGAMPGFRKFRSPYSGEMVYFRYFMDDLFELFVIANNSDDNTVITTGSGSNPADISGESEDLYVTWPINIGRYGLTPSFNWVH